MWILPIQIARQRWNQFDLWLVYLAASFHHDNWQWQSPRWQVWKEWMSLTSIPLSEHESSSGLPHTQLLVESTLHPTFASSSSLCGGSIITVLVHIHLCYTHYQTQGLASPAPFLCKHTCLTIDLTHYSLFHPPPLWRWMLHFLAS